MGYLNYEFFDEFKALDNLCKDIYGESVDHKLGVTLYLEDMDYNAYQGSYKVPYWTSDYNQLKSVRHIRNELAHSRNSITIDICSREDIDFVRSFKTRILNQTDPISVLRKQTTKSNSQSTHQHQPAYSSQAPTSYHYGCISLIASFLLIACIVAFLL